MVPTPLKRKKPTIE